MRPRSGLAAAEDRLTPGHCRRSSVPLLGGGNLESAVAACQRLGAVGREEVSPPER